MERELWKLLYELAAQLDKSRAAWRYRRSEIVAVYLWSVVHDRPMTWSLDRRNWPPELRPRRLPSQATLSRRMRHCSAEQLMTEIEQAWLALVNISQLLVVRVIDGKPLAVSNVTKDRESGYGRGAGGMQKGYKLHAIWGAGPLPIAWCLTPMNCSEKTVAKSLVPRLPPGGYLLGDAEYDSNPLHAVAQAAGQQLLTVKRQKKHGVGHRPQTTSRLRSIHLMKRRLGQALYQKRRQIERDFGNLVSFSGGLSCLPAWVRTFHRVRNWVQAKLLINAARWFRRRSSVIANA